MRSKPTAEQIAAMEARGWRYDADFGVGCFYAGRGLDDERGALSARVFPSGEGDWHASYGVPGQDYSAYQRYPDPLAAADVAEAWLREEIARFGFASLQPAGALSAIAEALGFPAGAQVTPAELEERARAAREAQERLNAIHEPVAGVDLERVLHPPSRPWTEMPWQTVAERLEDGRRVAQETLRLRNWLLLAQERAGQLEAEVARLGAMLKASVADAAALNTRLAASEQEREEQRLNLAAELGQLLGAPSARWRFVGRTWYGVRSDGGLDKIELHALLLGDGTCRMARVWTEQDRGGCEAERGRFDLARVAMIAADKAQPA